MKYKNWTDEQVQYLINNYGKEKTESISKHLNKSIGSLYYILKKENIEPENRWWSKEEVKLLKERYGSFSNQDLEIEFSRSEEAIQLKAESLGLKKDLWWSEEEIETLREMVFERLSCTKIAKTLERKRASVQDKLIEQNLTDDCRIWTDNELERIKELALSGEHTYLDIAMELNATPGQIYKACTSNKWKDKIKRIQSYGNDKMIKLIKDIFPNQIIKQEFNIGERLRLDVYIPQLKLGFEYDGIQHFRYTPQWHRTKEEFKRAQERDKRKDELCRMQQISLVRIKYNEELTKELLEKKIQTAINTDIILPKNKTLKKEKKKSKQKIQSRGFQNKAEGYKHKWPKRKFPTNN